MTAFRTWAVLAAPFLLGLVFTSATNGEGDSHLRPGHPLVGSWVVSVSSGMSGEKEALFTFFDDGNAIATDGAGRSWQGSWQETGERTGAFVLVRLAGKETGDRGATFIGTSEVEPDGLRWTRTLISQSGGEEIVGVRIYSE